MRFTRTELTRADWEPSTIHNFNGFKLGIVGYTLPELPTLIFPGYLYPFIIKDPVTTVNPVRRLA